MRDHIETVAMDFPPHVSECDATGWTPIASQRVGAPSIAESPVHIECVLQDVIDVGEHQERSGGVHLVLARVECITLDDDVCTPAYRVDPAALPLIGRLAFPWFSRAVPEAMFSLPRIPYSEYAAD